MPLAMSPSPACLKDWGLYAMFQAHSLCATAYRSDESFLVRFICAILFQYVADLCSKNSIAVILWRFRDAPPAIPSGRGSDVGRVGGRVVSACLASFRHFRFNTKYEKCRNTIYDKTLEMLLKRRARPRASCRLRNFSQSAFSIRSGGHTRGHRRTRCWFESVGKH